MSKILSILAILFLSGAVVCTGLLAFHEPARAYIFGEPDHACVVENGKDGIDGLDGLDGNDGIDGIDGLDTFDVLFNAVIGGGTIINLEKDPKLQELVLSTHHCYMHYLNRTGIQKIIENHLGASVITNNAPSV